MAASEESRDPLEHEIRTKKDVANRLDCVQPHCWRWRPQRATFPPPSESESGGTERPDNHNWPECHTEESYFALRARSNRVRDVHQTAFLRVFGGNKKRRVGFFQRYKCFQSSLIINHYLPPDLLCLQKQLPPQKTRLLIHPVGQSENKNNDLTEVNLRNFFNLRHVIKLILTQTWSYFIP